jgi:hypothetical protein
MNQLSNYTDNLHEKYNQFDTNHEVITISDELSDADRSLVQNALNTTFLNPKYKLKNFVSMGKLTPYATIRQWLLELKTSEENLETMEYTFRKLNIQVEILELQIKKESDLLQKKQLELELEKIKYDLRANERRRKTHYVERKQYVDLITEYLEGPEGKTPEGKSWLEVFGDFAEEDRWEEHYWTVRLARQASMDIVSYGRISAGNMEAINQMPPEQRNETLALSHEVSLRLEGLNEGIRQQVHHHLLATDTEYAKNKNAILRDPTEIKIEVARDILGDRTDASVNPKEENNPEELLDVYRP